MHDHDQRLGGFVFHHQRLHHRVRVQAQLARRFAGAAMVHVVVSVFRIGHLVLLQELGGGRFRNVAGFAHG
ncbi:hypothetical protein G6F23_015975 [Rhizopus arrhizus]|nr:hypothetical protein G6F23_015975 [Rhizopus arrhizus]